MKNRIIVGSGKTLQLEDKELINLNMQINDVSDISTRNSTYSNTINVPKNSHNQDVFEMLGVIGATTRFPYQKVPCRYLKDGIAIINSGYLQITDVKQDSYSVVMYDGIIDLSEALKDKDLADLSLLAQYNHILTEADYTDSFTNTTGYVYAFGDYGVEAPTDASMYPLEYQVPSLYAHNLVDDILTEAGFTYEGDIFTDPDYLSLLVAPSNGIPVEETPPALTETFLTSYDTDSAAVFEQDDVPFNQYPVDHNFTLADLADPDLELSDSKTILINSAMRLKIELATTYTVNNGSVRIFLRKNGVVLQEQFYDQNDVSGTENTTLLLPVEAGDTITMDIIVATYYDFVSDKWIGDANTSTDIDFTKVEGGQLMDFNLLYQEVSQADFIKDIMHRYGLLLIRDNYLANHLKFITLEDLLQAKPNAEDWTSKLVEITNESFTVDGYARNNGFKYKYESDVDVFDFDGTLSIDNEHLEQQKDLISSIFKIRLSTYSDMGVPIYTVPLYEEKTVDGTPTKVSKKTELTLFKVTTVNDSINFNVYGGISTNYAGDIPVMGFTDVGYQYYVDNYYTQLNLLLDNNKKISVELNLNTIEISQIDFFKLKFLKQTGKYYYLNSVKNNGDKTTAELIEINN